MALVGLCALTALACQPAQSADPRPPQVVWGEAIHTWNCARCHDPDRSIRTLSRELLVSGYPNAQALFRYISAAMPFDAPGTLPEDDYWAVTAYLLQREGLLTLGQDERLGPDDAPAVTLGAVIPGEAETSDGQAEDRDGGGEGDDDGAE